MSSEAVRNTAPAGPIAKANDLRLAQVPPALGQDHADVRELQYKERDRSSLKQKAGRKCFLHTTSRPDSSALHNVLHSMRNLYRSIDLRNLSRSFLAAQSPRRTPHPAHQSFLWIAGFHRADLGIGSNAIYKQNSCIATLPDYRNCMNFS